MSVRSTGNPNPNTNDLNPNDPINPTIGTTPLTSSTNPRPTGTSNPTPTAPVCLGSRDPPVCWERIIPARSGNPSFPAESSYALPQAYDPHTQHYGGGTSSVASNLVPHGTSSSMTSLSCTEQVLARLRTNLLSFALANIKDDLGALALHSNGHGIISTLCSPALLSQI